MSEVLGNEALEIEEDTQKNKFLIFSLESESYGIEIRHVTEIIGLQPITQVPEMPEYIMGIINLRGKIIPVMDVRLRFNKESREYNDRTCVIVIEINDIPMGLIIDSVSEVIPITGENIVEPPSIYSEGGRYINGIGKVEDEVVLLLDSDRLLNEEESENLANTI
ncbi:purine-binding chemotaxis protein CheW [Peptoclostridium litorale DSM 5388]|uniref:Chemotaxis signal transduction protein n=1 Tax=Peptoclostridium litorale DSM 5388 TaxID=1121324 RepID=A0A069RK05_PEPLI|nr:chemotaxis protein CheW [Peptoclostridium litorale]KDR94557.1 chemotaxis signal transduction protein [Peptoclostridium litorale DSM 5388]SIO31360.1 purine-binding chemotaxis protein CheW [Peptoclostridium litorale DSM 5388]